MEQLLWKMERELNNGFIFASRPTQISNVPRERARDYSSEVNNNSTPYDIHNTLQRLPQLFYLMDQNSCGTSRFMNGLFARDARDTARH